MPEPNASANFGSTVLDSTADALALVRVHASTALAFAEKLVGVSQAPSIARASFLRVFRERRDPFSGSDLVRVLIAVRQVVIERGFEIPPGAARWIRETTRCSKSTIAAILGVGVVDVAMAILEDIDLLGARTLDKRCEDARSELHDLMVDGEGTSRAAMTASHLHGCSDCAAVFERVRSARSAPIQDGDAGVAIELAASDFEQILGEEARSRMRSRVLPWVGIAALGVAVILIWAPWTNRNLSPTRDPSVAPGWWQAALSSPMLQTLVALGGGRNQVPNGSLTIGPNGEFLVQTMGFAVIPSRVKDGGGLTAIPKGKVGKIGFDGAEAWWEGGDGIVRRMDPDEARRVTSQVLGFADVITRVVRGIESKSIVLENGETVQLQGSEATRYSVKLPGVGDLVPMSKVSVWIGRDGRLRQMSTGYMLVRTQRLTVGANENPCAWTAAVPSGLIEQGK